MAAAASQIRGLGQQIATVGAVAGIAFVGIAGAATKMAGDFEFAVNKLYTTAGEAKGNLDKVSKGILDMAGQVGYGAQDLVDAMYYVSSAGFTYAKGGLDVLRAAAMGAKAENADLTDTVRALAAAMNAYKDTAQNPITTMNTLIAATARGSMQLEDLVVGLKNVLPASANFKLSLVDAAGAMAVMTTQGDNAASAGTHLRQLLFSITMGAKPARDSLKAIGTTIEEVQKSMQTKGLPETLQYIIDLLGKKFPKGSEEYNVALRSIFGGTRQLMGGLELTGAHMQTFIDTLKGMRQEIAAGGNTIYGWAAVQDTFNFKMDAARARVESIVIAIGTKMLPVMGDVVSGMGPVIDAFGRWATSSGGLVDMVKNVVLWMQTLFRTLADNGALKDIGVIFSDIGLIIRDVFLIGLQTVDLLLGTSFSKNIDDTQGKARDLADAIKIATGAIRDILEPLRNFVGAMTEATPQAQAFRVALGGIAIAFTSIKIGEGLVAGINLIARFATWLIPILVTGLGALIPALAGVSIAGAPIWAIILAIAAAIAGLIIVIRNWGAISQWLTTTFGPLIAALQNFGNILATNIGPVIQQIGTWIVDTFGPAFQALAGWISSTVVPALQKFGAVITTVIWPAIQSLVGIIVSQFKPVWDTIVTVFQNQIIPAFQQLWTAIQPLVSLIGEQLRSAWNMLLPVIQPILPLLGGIAAVLGGVLVSAIGVAISVIAGLAKGLANLISGLAIAIGGVVQIFSGIVSVISGVVMLIVHLVTGQWGKLGEDIKKIWQGVGSVISGVWNTIMGVIGGAIGFIVGLVGGFISNIIKFFQNLWKALVGGSIVPDIVNGIVSWFTSLVKLVIGIVTNLVTSVINFFTNLFKQTTAIFSAMGAMLNAAWNLFWKTITTFATNIFNTVVTIFTNVWHWLTSTWNNIGSGISNAWNTFWRTISTWLTNIWNTVVQKARDIFNGIMKPFNDFGAAVGGVLKGAVNTIIDWLNNGINKMNDFIQFIANGINTVSKALGAGDVIKNTRPIPTIGYLAKGTEYWPGGMALVGEQGRELALLPRGSAVLPNRETEALLRVMFHQGYSKSMHNPEGLVGFAGGIDVMAIFTALAGNVGQAIMKLIGTPPSLPGGFFAQIVGGLMGKITGWIGDWVKGLLASWFGGGAHGSLPMAKQGNFILPPNLGWPGYPGHHGMDFGFVNQPVPEVTGGIVSPHTGWYPWGGEVDVLVSQVKGLWERYLHLSSILVRAGQVVSHGDIIGISGGGTPATGLGAWSNGPHLHIQYDWGDYGNFINPLTVWASLGIFKPFAKGGKINEQILGLGTRTGKSYLFGEQGRQETVTPTETTERMNMLLERLIKTLDDPTRVSEYQVAQALGKILTNGVR